MEFDEIDELDDEIAKQDLISNLELIEGLEKESVAVDELLLRQRLIDDIGHPSYDCQMDYSTLKPTSLKSQGKESKDISSKQSWGHGNQEENEEIDVQDVPSKDSL